MNKREKLCPRCGVAKGQMKNEKTAPEHKQGYAATAKKHVYFRGEKKRI